MQSALDATGRLGVALLSALALGCSAASKSEPEATSSMDAGRRVDEGGKEAGSPRDGGDAALGDASTMEGGPGSDASIATDAHSGEGDGADGTDGLDCAHDKADGGDAPAHLACTGLYADWASRTIAPGIRPYTPGFTLWSDGAEKSRYIYLPPGTQIDTTDMDQWTFPVGTKLWKEFRLEGLRVETRLLWKRADFTWLRTTYAWSIDQSTATELTTGRLGWNGTSYEIPAQTACQDCHAGRLDNVLGFEAVSLAAPVATGLTMSVLVAEGLLTQPPVAPIVVPGNATESAALGWLHANCGIACHNATSFDCASTLYMRLNVASLATVGATDTWNTAVGRPLSGLDTAFVPPWPMLRITPGDPMASAVSYRASVRDTDPAQSNQMPPLDTHVVPDAGVAILNAWIQSIPRDAGAD
jgi:hypothetical protein